MTRVFLLGNNNLFILSIWVLFSVNIYSQTDIMGKWRVNELIGYPRSSTEYVLLNPEKDLMGNILELKQDGTFLSSNSAPCGNDCFITISGTYELVDEFHIHFIVENFHSGMFCTLGQPKSNFIKDLGVFYIYKEGKNIRLIPSNGVLQDDKDIMQYKDMTYSFNKNWKSYNYKWTNTDANLPDEIVNNYINEKKLIDLYKCKVVFSTNVEYGQLFLLREKDKFYYILYNQYDKKVSLAYPKLKS